MSTTGNQTQIYFEDVAENMDLPGKSKGPLTVTDLVRFAGASGDYALIHHDREHAKKVAGLPDIILHGQAKLAFMIHLITDWIGLEGKLKKIGAQYRGIDIVGDTVETNGKITKKFTENGENLVEIALENRNERGVTATGTAIISLPSKN